MSKTTETKKTTTTTAEIGGKTITTTSTTEKPVKLQRTVTEKGESTKSAITLTPMGAFFFRAADPKNEEVYTPAALKARVGESEAAKYELFASELYTSACTMNEVRETSADNHDAVWAAEHEVKELAEKIFSACGSRPSGRYDKNGDDILRPAYSCRSADFSIIGEMAEKARAMAGSDAAAPDKFKELFALTVGRMLNGLGLGRVTGKALKDAKRLAAEKRTQKAKETRIENERKKEEEAKQKAEAEQNAASLLETIFSLVNNSSATEEEKAAITEKVKEYAEMK